MARQQLPNIIRKHEAEILTDWIGGQKTAKRSTGPNNRDQLKSESSEFLRHFVDALEKGGTENIAAGEWEETRSLLANLSRTRERQGFTPVETANSVFSLKRPLFERLRSEIDDAEELAQELWNATAILDALGLYTTESYQSAREDVISRQQQELLELSTPVIRLWEGVLAVPLIGTLDSARTQIVMESLLTEIVSTGASISVIDITGVPTVDTLVAQHLLKTVAAARLMGADCIISGIRPQIAQTIVHLGVDLGDVVTKASLADAFQYALRLKGLRVQSAAPSASE